MPNIDNITPVLYQPLDPYQVNYDNIPLTNILQRIDLVNTVVDQMQTDIANAQGTQGSIAGRLNKSLNSDGSLITSAVDLSLHSIEEHTDTVNFVRMTIEERAKLNLISSTAFQLQIDTFSNTYLFSNQLVEFVDSDTVTWNVDMPNQVSANIAFPTSAIRQHYYGLIPVTFDYQNYVTTSLNTEYIPGSLRIFINGIRINQNPNSVYVYGPTGPNSTWVLTNYQEVDPTQGLFSLNRAISSTDKIFIDFDSTF